MPKVRTRVTSPAFSHVSVWYDAETQRQVYLSYYEFYLIDMVQNYHSDSEFYSEIKLCNNYNTFTVVSKTDLRLMYAQCDWNLTVVRLSVACGIKSY